MYICLIITTIYRHKGGIKQERGGEWSCAALAPQHVVIIIHWDHRSTIVRKIFYHHQDDQEGQGKDNILWILGVLIHTGI